MNKPPDFLARQLLDDLDMLVEQVALRLRQVPWYQTADPHALRMMIRQDCLALTAALATNDLGSLRQYVEQMGRVRLRAGAPATSLIAGISLMEEEMRSLLGGAAGDPAGASEAIRWLQTIIRNSRMMLSNVNLRMLTEETLPPPRP